MACAAMQVVSLGHQPASQLPSRDSRAKEEATACGEDSGPICDSNNSSHESKQNKAEGNCLDQACTSKGTSPGCQHQPQSNESPCDGATAIPKVMYDTLQEDLQQLRSSFLLLQEEYWRQKERLLALDLEMAKTTADADQAAAVAHEVRPAHQAHST